MTEKTREALIVGITPYFLDRGNLWFKENKDKILQACKTQSFFQDNILYVRQPQKFNFSQFLRKLDELGYEKVYKIQSPGKFSQKGGIIEVFPINSDFALRIDFLGNNIESIEKLELTIKDDKKEKDTLKKKLKSQKLFSDLKNLKPGDYLVHLDHGVGRFIGIEKALSSEHTKYKLPAASYYLLEYSHDDKLYVPLGLERKLSRYVGFSDPKVSRLGSLSWQNTKRKIREETEKLAKELLEVYAGREISLRPPYLPLDEIDQKIASDFPYKETPDQIQAIREINSDLEKEKPMDRIVCGDVGFGKTEVALRTMVRVVKSGCQASLICPTTILASQHYQNFKNRLKNLPIKISLLSRLQTKKEQKEIIENIKQGKTDMTIGTHRLLSQDVVFQKLGLLVIDDEQRFGVRQKEKFKKMRKNLDILSLSATPIPRTLYLALSSLKEISIIQTPPEGRLPPKTFVAPWKEETIKKAIENEIKRNGQVYYLHNRIETIESIKKFLEELVPQAKFSVAHGRIKEKELVRIMTEFQNKKTDVLIATTIIENGLDIPNVNTLIVDDAVKLGLSQAYQLRGRVGRSYIQSFAYFLFEKHLSGLAKVRLNALKKAKELRSGYQISLKDLEIRGAGNILGKEQSGSVNQVGLNLYCQMLSEAVDRLKQNNTDQAAD